jgi:transposase
VRSLRVWGRLLQVEQVVVESVRFDEVEQAVVVGVRLLARVAGRCGVCGRRCPGFDRGRGRRRWRTVDVGVVRAFLEADAPRVRCAVHGVVVARVPWARHGSGHTYAFDDLVAWLARQTSRSAVCGLLRISWRTVGQVIARVMADADAAAPDRWAGVRRIGIDEISYRRGHKYLTVVVDHDTRRPLWIGEGRSKATLAQFFDQLGPERCAQIALVSADGADWIFYAVAEYLPNAKLCLDPFHVVAWAGDALDKVRAQVWSAVAKDLKGARWALWKNPQDLTEGQQAKLARIAATNQPLYRAYLLKEQLRQVFAPGGEERVELLDQWLAWAARSRLAPFVDLARRIRTYFRQDIVNTLVYRMSNGILESTNTKIRLLTRIAFGFHSAAALIAMINLHLGGHHIDPPGRGSPT